MLQIVVIQQFLLPLEGDVAIGKLTHQPAQSIHQRRHLCQIGAAFRLGAAEHIRTTGHRLFRRIPQGFDLFLGLGESLILRADGSQTAKGKAAHLALHCIIGGGGQKLTQTGELLRLAQQRVHVRL